MQEPSFPFIKIYQMQEKRCIIFREPISVGLDNVLELLEEAQKDVQGLNISDVRLVDVIDENKQPYKALEWTEQYVIPEGYIIQ